VKRRGRADWSGIGVSKVVGAEHGGAERRCPFHDLGAEILEERGGPPSAEQHDVGGGMSGEEKGHGSA